MWSTVSIILLNVTVTLCAVKVNFSQQVLHGSSLISLRPIFSSQVPQVSLPHSYAETDTLKQYDGFENKIVPVSTQKGWMKKFVSEVTSSSVIANKAVLASKNRSNTTKQQLCSEKFHSLDKCLVHISQISDTGIPSTPHAVDAACKVWETGMACVDDWTSKCLQKDQIAKLKASISGAYEVFTFMCRDPKFRQDFLKHGDCYKRIGTKWDNCNQYFLDDIKQNQSELSTRYCCARFSFLQCVSKINHYYCNRKAAKFLHRVAEALVRTNEYPQCVSIHLRNCSMVNSSPIFTFSTFTTVLLSSFLFYQFALFCDVVWSGL